MPSTSPLSKANRLGKLLLGSVVVLATSPTGLGPALGGWVAGHRSGSPVRGGLAAGVAGLLGAAPLALLVYLASAGAFEPLGYHEGTLHVGINTLAPGTLAPWQELALAALVAAVVVGVAVLGGVAAGLGIDSLDGLQDEPGSANGAE